MASNVVRSDKLHKYSGFGFAFNELHALSLLCALVSINFRILMYCIHVTDLGPCQPGLLAPYPNWIKLHVSIIVS